MINNFIVTDTQKFSEFCSPLSNTVASIEDLFYWIRLSYTFYDYSTLLDVIKLSQCDEAIKLMDEYVNEIKDILIEDLNLQSLTQTEYKHSAGRSKLVILSEKKTMSAKEYNSFIKMFTECLGLPQGSFTLKATISGSTVLVYEISPKVKNHLINFVFDVHKLKPLNFLKISCLIIDEEVELKVPLDGDTEVTLYVCSA